MTKKTLIIGGIILLVVIVLATLTVGAATTTTAARGLAEKVREGDNEIDVFVNHTSSGLTTLKGTTTTFKVKSATFYKIVNGKKVAAKLSSIKANEDELLLKGLKKSGSKYTADSVEITERGGRFVVKVRDKNLTDKTNQTFKVEVLYSSYKPTQYEKKEVFVVVDGDTKFTGNGQSRQVDEIATKDQKARIEFKVRGGGTLYATEFEDDYKKAK